MNSLEGISPNEMLMSVYRKICISVHNSTIDNSPKLLSTQMSINRRINK